MSRSKENVLELYVHFIILGVVGLISLGLLFKFVIMSPNNAEYMGQTVTPSDVDQKILEQAKRIETKLASEPEPKSRYTPKAVEFEALMKDSMPNLTVAYFSYPGEESAAIESQRQYAVPAIPAPTNMVADHVRTVAFVPLVDMGIEDSYETIPTDVADTDIVTVQATINVTALYENFDKTFAGRSLKAQWRDPQLAKVIFAGVQLQRQQLVDGVWTDWKVVPRTKIDKYRQVFSDVYEAQEPSKSEILMPQFIIPDLWKNALQPNVYDIAQLDMKWYPPSLLADYEKEISNVEKERQRTERETAKTADRASRTATRETGRTPAAGAGMGDGMGMGGMGGMGMGMEGMGGGGAAERTPTRTREPRAEREEKPAPKVQQKRDFDKEYTDIKIKEDADLGKLRDNLVVWAHDDTAEPGQTYRYKLRYGVFNPVAGKGWYDEQSAAYNDQIVLWSEFTDVTDKFAIDKRQYIFPTGSQANGAVVKVAKLMLGNWKTRDFLVKPGEFIGYEVEEQQKPSTTTQYNRDLGTTAETITEKIDYATGMVFVDLVDVKDWELAGTIKERVYQSMIYTENGDVYSIPAKDRFWPADLVSAQKVINSSAGKIVEISKDRSMTGTRTTPGGMGGDGMGMPGMGMDGMGMPGMPGMGMPGMMGM